MCACVNERCACMREVVVESCVSVCVCVCVYVRVCDCAYMCECVRV